MSFRLPRLRDIDTITAGNNPAPLFIRWWQSFVEKLETNNTAIENILDGLTGVEGSITGLQAQDDTLDGLAALDTTTGLVEQTGADTFTKRAIGDMSASDIPTLGIADNRYVKVGAITASAATPSTHKLAWVDPVSGTTYYFLVTT